MLDKMETRVKPANDSENNIEKASFNSSTSLATIGHQLLGDGKRDG